MWRAGAGYVWDKLSPNEQRLLLRPGAKVAGKAPRTAVQGLRKLKRNRLVETRNGFMHLTPQGLDVAAYGLTQHLAAWRKEDPQSLLPWQGLSVVYHKGIKRPLATLIEGRFPTMAIRLSEFRSGLVPLDVYEAVGLVGKSMEGRFDDRDRLARLLETMLHRAKIPLRMRAGIVAEVSLLFARPTEEWAKWGRISKRTQGIVLVMERKNSESWQVHEYAPLSGYASRKPIHVHFPNLWWRADKIIEEHSKQYVESLDAADIY